MKSCASFLPDFLVLAKSLGRERSPSTVKRIRMPTYDTQGSSAGAGRRVTGGRSLVCRSRRSCQAIQSCQIESFVEKSEEKEAQAQAPARRRCSASAERRIVGDTHRPQTFGIAFLIFYLSCKASKSQ
jgi:hypothetical protein